jgi:hypothetical protein
MKRSSSLVAALLVVTMSTAYADPHKVLVLQSEGRVDAVLRTKVDASILKLAKSIAGADVSSGDTTLSDAAAAVGCKPDASPCRDEILGMLSVDELIWATLTPKPGGTEVEVHRASKGGGMAEAKMLLATGGSADKLDGVAPLFGGKPAEPVTTPVTTPTEPVTTPTNLGEPGSLDPRPTEPATTPNDPAAQPLPTPGQPVDMPNRGRQRLELAGMIGGGALVLIGFMCWGSASDIQSQVDDAPTQTKPQIDTLRDLESRGDAYAAWGNVFFLGGAVLGGISTYFFIKDRRAHRHATTARIAPTVFDHGAGLALTFGGTP